MTYTMDQVKLVQDHGNGVREDQDILMVATETPKVMRSPMQADHKVKVVFLEMKG